MGCYHSKVINAPIAKVWQAVRDFHNVKWAKGVAETLDIIGSKAGDQLGARRKLNGAFTETLVGLDDLEHVITYTIDDGPGPLEGNKCTGYVGKVRLAQVTDGDHTFIQWSSTWQESQGGVKELCDPIYKALLDALAAHFA